MRTTCGSCGYRVYTTNGECPWCGTISEDVMPSAEFFAVLDELDAAEREENRAKKKRKRRADEGAR